MGGRHDTYKGSSLPPGALLEILRIFTWLQYTKYSNTLFLLCLGKTNIARIDSWRYNYLLYRVSMAARCTQGWKQGWEDRGTAECEKLMKQADQSPGKVNHPETEEACLKIMEDWRDKWWTRQKLCKPRQRTSQGKSEVS
jgi:hypothetical protein